jgi:hypothetical protein
MIQLNPWHLALEQSPNNPPPPVLLFLPLNLQILLIVLTSLTGD